MTPMTLQPNINTKKHCVTSTSSFWLRFYILSVKAITDWLLHRFNSQFFHWLRQVTWLHAIFWFVSSSKHQVFAIRRQWEVVQTVFFILWSVLKLLDVLEEDVLLPRLHLLDLLHRFLFLWPDKKTSSFPKLKVGPMTINRK